MRTTSSRPARATEPAEPALVAETLYLRPAARTPLLQALAELGVFVRELASPRLADAWHLTGPPPDFMVLIAAGTPEQARLVRHLVTERQLPVAVIVSGKEQMGPLLSAGAVSAACDDDPAGLSDAVRLAATAARATRADVSVAVDRLIFGNVELQASPASLAAGAATVRLSPVEFQVLVDLVQAQGRIVARNLLESRLGADDRPVSRGYLKSVIGRIRRKVERLGGDPLRLVSVRGTGYRLDG